MALKGEGTAVGVLDAVVAGPLGVAGEAVGRASKGRGGTFGVLPMVLGIGEDGASGVAALIVLTKGVFVAVLPKSKSSRSFTRPPPGCPAWACNCALPFLMTMTVGISFSGVKEERKLASCEYACKRSETAFWLIFDRSCPQSAGLARETLKARSAPLHLRSTSFPIPG